MSKKYKTWEYKCVKDMFERATVAYANDTFVYEKQDPKGKFEEFTFNKFREDVIGFGTALNEILHLNKSKIVVIRRNKLSLVCFIYEYIMWSRNFCTSR